MKAALPQPAPPPPHVFWPVQHSGTRVSAVEVPHAWRPTTSRTSKHVECEGDRERIINRERIIVLVFCLFVLDILTFCLWVLSTGIMIVTNDIQ